MEARDTDAPPRVMATWGDGRSGPDAMPPGFALCGIRAGSGTSWRAGLVFLAAFACVVAWFVRRYGGQGSPPPFLIPFVVATGATALVFFPGGVLDRARKRLAHARRARRGGDPWWADRAWHPDGESSRLQYPGQNWLGRSGCLVLPVYMALRAAEHGGVLPSGTAFGGIVLLVVVSACLHWMRGRVHAAAPAFPQFSGGEIEFHVGTTPGGARIDHVSVVLRCLRDEVSLGGWQVAASFVWGQQACLDGDAYIAPDTDVRARFVVPAGLPGTSRFAGAPVTWELLVVGRLGWGPNSPGREVFAVIPVPIYPAPRARAAEAAQIPRLPGVSARGGTE